MRSGGPSVYARRLVAGLRATGSLQVRTVERGCGRPFSPWGRVAVAAAARHWRADLVHGLHVEAPPGRRPAVVTVQDLVPLDYAATLPGPGSRVAFRLALHAACERAARLIVPSPTTAARLARYGVRQDAVVIVPLAAGPEFQPAGADKRHAARVRFAGGHRYLVASSSRRPHKNLHGLLRAVADLGDGVVVILTGAPIDGATGVTFTGHLVEAEVAALYAGAEAMVLPAFVEGFGLPALEALACGVPVVCGEGVGALHYGRAGAIVVDVRRPGEIAGAVQTLLHDDALRNRLGAAGAAAVAPLTVEAMASATLAVYREVLSPS